MQCLVLVSCLHVVIGYCYVVSVLLSVCEQPTPVHVHYLSSDVSTYLPRFVVDTLFHLLQLLAADHYNSFAVLNSIR